MTLSPRQIAPSYLQRRAFAYLRQSSEAQVLQNVGSTAVQRELANTLIDWGWPPHLVATIDEDLGKSGSVPGQRSGFQYLIETMQTGSVGIVVVTDTSRLARNPLEFAIFADAAKQHDVLLAYGSTLIDFQDPNSEFFALLLGNNAARENRVRIDLASRARRKKAEQGIATTPPPIGYVTGHERTWLQTPDPRVRDAIQLIFDKFLELGSAGAVWRYCARQNVQLPGLTRDKRPRWQPPSRVVVTRILRNETYAGVYVFGKWERRRRGAGGTGVTTSKRPPHLQIRHPNHHEPYVPHPTWLTIQQRLSENRYRAKPFAGRGSALLQGLIRCTVHGLTLRTIYQDRPSRSAVVDKRRVPTYRCVPQMEFLDARCCQIQGLILDSLVVSHVLRALKSPSLDVLRHAGSHALREGQALLRQRRQAEDAAAQAVSQAERAYEEIAVSQPLMKQRFAKRLEEALERQQVLVDHHRRHPLAAPVVLDDAELSELQRLKSSVPALWSAVTSQERKQLLRLAIQTIHVTPSEKAWQVELEWTGGARTCAEVLTQKGASEIIVAAFRQGHAVEEIAELLNERGAVVRAGSQPGSPYSAATVRRVLRSVRLNHELDREAALVVRDLFIAGEPLEAIAKELTARGIRDWSGDWDARRIYRIVKLLRAGGIPGVSPIPHTPALEPAVVALHREGLLPRIIAAQLTAAGHRTRTRRPVTVATVRGILARRGRSPNTPSFLQVPRLLAQWVGTASVAEITDRLNSGGFRTIRGRKWTVVAVRNRLRKLGLAKRHLEILRRHSQRRRPG